MENEGRQMPEHIKLAYEDAVQNVMFSLVRPLNLVRREAEVSVLPIANFELSVDGVPFRCRATRQHGEGGGAAWRRSALSFGGDSRP